MHTYAQLASCQIFAIQSKGNNFDVYILKTLETRIPKDEIDSFVWLNQKSTGKETLEYIF